MSWINGSLLPLLGLAIVPVVLHFLLRAKPKKLAFPALQLVRLRRRSNVRRLRLRHVWLLLLRMAVLAVIVLALARPSLPPGRYGPTWREGLTLAAIAAVAWGAYAAFLRRWRQARLPQHQLASRRTMLRGATGAAAALLAALLVLWPYQRRIVAGWKDGPQEVAPDLPVAAVLLIDTSLSMEYRLENKDRLAVAKEIAAMHVETFPAGSRVGVADTSRGHPVLFQADRTAALARLEDLRTSPLSVPLDERLRTALRLQEEDRKRTLDGQESTAVEQRQDRFVREIYVFTDLARSAWRSGSADGLRQELERLRNIGVYLIDVGVEEPVDLGVSEVQLSKESLSRGEELLVHATLVSSRPEETEITAEIHVESATGQLVKQGQTTAKATRDSPARTTFAVRRLDQPIVRGEVRIAGSDPWAGDDVRYFTVAVRSPVSVLVVGDRRSDAAYWIEALAPEELVRLGAARNAVAFVPTSRLAETDLTGKDVVCLIDAAKPSAADWEKLGAFVAGGGGLAVVAGMPGRTDPTVAAAWDVEPARKLLPGSLLADLSFADPVRLDLPDLTHPLLHKFEELGGTGELTLVDVQRHWRVEPRDEAAVLGRFTDPRRSPALLERVVGRGRVVLLATGVDLDGWADLPLARWSFVAFADQTVQHLAQRTRDRFVYVAGDDVRFAVEPSPVVRRYLHRKPGLEQTAGEIEPKAEQILLSEVEQVGQHQIVAAPGESAKIALGFSVNPAATEADLTRLSQDELDRMLGAERYRVARSTEDLVREVVDVRLGQEVFPLVFGAMLLCFCLEHLAANRFYESEQSEGAAAT